jgi:ATP-dependent DNA helicase PIF1
MSVQRWGERSDGILPTKLHTHRDSCDADNSMQLAALPGEAVRFDAKVDAGTKTSALRQLEASCPAKASLQLKEGAQVMLVKTIDLARGLVNGARGVVVR